MRCERCQGWMVHERYYGAGSAYWGWRCVFCSDILDSVIWKNRHYRGNIPLPEGHGSPTERRER